MQQKLSKLRHAMNVAQEIEMKPKKYDGRNDDDPCKAHSNSAPK